MRSLGGPRPAAFAFTLLAGLASCAAQPPDTPPRPLAPRIVAVHPHDPDAYTQGLLWSHGRLYESTGQYGFSRLREIEIATGRVLREVALPDHEFGEGIALIGDRLVQLTWREGVVRFWSRSSLAPLGQAPLPGEGWGLTFDGEHLIVSDGSDRLAFRSPADLELARELRVRRADGRSVPYLNELEWADGALYANVWQSDEIVRIDTVRGVVTASWDAAGLLDSTARAQADVLNGIAWNPERRVFYLTGKYWPQLFEVELPPPAP